MMFAYAVYIRLDGISGYVLHLLSVTFVMRGDIPNLCIFIINEGINLMFVLLCFFLFGLEFLSLDSS